MAHSDEVRKAVRAAYVFDQITLDAAAVSRGVPVGTARRWKTEAKAEGDDWDRARGAQMIAGGGLEDVIRQTLAIAVQQVQATIEQIQAEENMPPAVKVKMLAALADSYNKLLGAAKRLMPETDKLATAMDVVQRFAEFVAKRHPEHAPAFVDMLDSFGTEIERAYAGA